MEKHLEFIQGVINRHNSNSFMMKGWCITIAAALYALAGTVKNPEIVQIAYIPILLFWGLDAFYLSNERCFIDLYNAVAQKGYKLPKKSTYKKYAITNKIELEEGTVNSFEMHYTRFKIWRDNKWINVLWSKTIFGFYIPMFILSRIVFCFIA